ncbi:MAG: hypothetical protein ACRDPE_15295 [Solirubrobacterales bacterium]
MASEDAQAAADVLLPLIRRVAPGAMEGAELVEKSGLETGEIREGIAVLVENGSITETDDGYQAAGATGDLATAVAAAGGPDDTDDDGPETDDPASPASVPGAGQSYRATFSITATYGGTTNDAAAMQQAAAMEEEIADAIHGLYPNAVIAVDVEQIEAYKPRVIYGKGAPAEEDKD